MNGRKLGYKVLMGIPAVIVCILFGCQKKDALVLESPMEQLKEMDLAQTNEAKSGDSQFSEQADSEEEKQAASYEAGQETPEEAEEAKKPLVIHICGAVVNPGVYELEPGARLYHAIEMAGGFAEDADREYLNQAQKLTDGMQITIPTIAQTEQADAGNTDSRQYIKTEESETVKVTGNTIDEKLININTASEEDLCLLPGVGSERAKSIIAYRSKNGQFNRIEDIMNITGIKEGMFAKIKDKITVG